MKVKYIVLSIVLILIAVTAFYYLNPSKALTFVLPDVNEITLVTADIKNDTAHTRLNMIMQNKSVFRLTIDTIYIKVQSDDLIVVEQKIPVHLDQKPLAIDSVTLPVNISLSQVYKMVEAHKNMDSTTISTTCYVQYNTIFGEKKLSISKTRRIKVPILPKVKVVKVEYKGFDLKTGLLRAKAKIAILNNGQYVDLQIEHIKYWLEVKNTFHSEGSIDKPVAIKPNSSTYIDLPIEIVLEHPLKTALVIALDNDKTAYVLKMKYEIHNNKSKSLNILPVELNAEGVMELVK
jgi:LEA14-like dessication related protein